MFSKMKRFFVTLLVLVISISLFVMPAQAAEKKATVEIPVSVKLSGTLPAVSETFQIQLKADNASFPMPKGAANSIYTLPIVGAGSGEFSITFNDLGIYSYTISQKAGSNNKCFYDETVYEMTVYVTNAADGGFETNVAIYKKGESEKLDNVVFNNRYANPAKVTLTAIKTLNNRTPNDNAFSFLLLNKNGELEEKVYNKGQAVTFKTLVFDEEGTFVYTMQETIGSKSNIKYDKSVFTITIVVEKDENGDYQAQVSYEKNDKAYEGTPRFANKTRSTTPQTGDMFKMGLWVSLLVLSFVGLVVLVFFTIKKRKK